MHKINIRLSQLQNAFNNFLDPRAGFCVLQARTRPRPVPRLIGCYACSMPDVIAQPFKRRKLHRGVIWLISVRLALDLRTGADLLQVLYAVLFRRYSFRRAPVTRYQDAIPGQRTQPGKIPGEIAAAGIEPAELQRLILRLHNYKITTNRIIINTAYRCVFFSL